MKELKNLLGGIAFLALALAIFLAAIGAWKPSYGVDGVECGIDPAQSEIALPAPEYAGIGLEKAIGERRSVRKYTGQRISLEELSMLLWAGQGITSSIGGRAAPSAGATYPMELYVVPNRVEGAGCGIYRYVPQEHKLVLVREGEFREEVAAAAFGQAWARNAGAVIVMGAVRERTASRYGERADLYIAIEAGHISQNILLEAVSLGLGAVPIGAFDEEAMDRIIGAGEGESSIYLVAVGKV